MCPDVGHGPDSANGRDREEDRVARGAGEVHLRRCDTRVGGGDRGDVPSRIAGSPLNRLPVIVVSGGVARQVHDRRMVVSVCGRTVVVLGMIVIGVVVHVLRRRQHPRHDECVNEDESRQAVHGASLLRRRRQFVHPCS